MTCIVNLYAILTRSALVFLFAFSICHDHNSRQVSKPLIAYGNGLELAIYLKPVHFRSRRLWLMDSSLSFQIESKDV